MPNKKNKRGSGNKNTQFENAILSSMKDGIGKTRGFMDSPGMQGPDERRREEQFREMFIEATRKMAKEDKPLRRSK